MGINNYTYLIESLWVLNVKCSWQKSLKQTHCTNTNDYCYCRWGNCGSGKLSDLLKVSWLVNVRTPKLVFPINHKGPRIFQLQHTIYLPHHTPLPEMSIHPMKLPLKYSCWSQSKIPLQQYEKPIMLPSRHEMGYHWAPCALPKPCYELTVTRNCNEDTGGLAAGVECRGMEEAPEHGALSQAHDVHNGSLLSSKADTEDSQHGQYSNPTFRGSFAFPVRDL